MQKRSISAGLFTCSHMNPTGISLNVAQKQQLAELANKYHIPIIEDDIYHELDHRGTPPLPACHWDKGVIYYGVALYQKRLVLVIGWGGVSLVVI